MRRILQRDAWYSEDGFKLIATQKETKMNSKEISVEKIVAGCAKGDPSGTSGAGGMSCATQGIRNGAYRLKLMDSELDGIEGGCVITTNPADPNGGCYSHP